MNVCLLRLSALGDITHALTVVRRIQERRPGSRITWVIGRLEHKLLTGIDGVEFIVFDKASGGREFLNLRRALAGRRFDALLHMQVSFRANLASACISADRRVGYDRNRAKDLHGLFVSERIAPGHKQHVLDAMQSFLEPLGIEPGAPRWGFALGDADLAFAEQHVARDRATLAISPVSSHQLRNWNVAGYAAVADCAVQEHGMQVILTGGPSAYERDFCERIEKCMQADVLNLAGKDTLKQLAALLGASDLVLAPDTGPMHIANAMGTDVIGLHAASNPRRSGPYHSLRWCVDRYDEAAQRFLKKNAAELKWGTKIEYPGVMDLIRTKDVIEKLDAWIAEKYPSAAS